MVREHREELAAVVVEPLVQGAAGMKLCPPESFAALADACRETGVLLICDEVATGFGRTGTLFACEQAGLRPDILCLGKGLGAGYLPISATVANKKVYDRFLGEDLGPRTLYHGHSFGGNALAAAVGLEHLRLLQRWNVLDNVKDRSEQLRELLGREISPLPTVKDIRLQGLMCGIEVLPGDRRGRRICAAAVERSILLRPLGDVVVVMPPLTITAEEIERIVDALKDSIEAVG
jgi:adenosylmethionine---8-amino-7-oxononanoate aminotransferase